MDVSLIICTRNRCRRLARCLEAVERIEFSKSWELVVVDNGSTDATAATIATFANRFRGKLSYLLEPRPGLGHARNAGLGVATGETIAFTDDDCYPAPDFLAQISSVFADDANLGYISGRILLHDREDIPIAVNESITPLTFAAKSFVPAGSVQGANMAFRRAALQDIGGFDSCFGSGSLFYAEDIDAAGRASAAGWKGRYCPQVVVRHHHGRKASDAARQWRSAGIGIGAYHMKILLQAGEWRWATPSQIRRRLGMNRKWIFWEAVGAARYASVFLRERLRATANAAVVRR